VVDHLEFEAEQPQCCPINAPPVQTVWISEHTWDANQASLLPAIRTGRVREVFAVTVSGETPRYNGWTFVATLEPLATDDGVENIVRAVPGKDCPVEFRSRVGQCDHCHTNRRRTNTYVVCNEAGAHKCVGRNCLKDFLGHDNPHALAAAAELLAELGGLCSAAEEEFWSEGGWGRGAEAWSLEHFLGYTSSVINQYGWVSRGKAFDEGSLATADRVLYLLTPPLGRPKSWLDAVAAARPDKAAIAEAEEAIEWAKSMDPGDNDYLYNLGVLARAGYASRKTAGLAASLLTAYRRVVDLAAEANRPESRHVGVLKRRAEFEVTVKRIFASEGAYGTTGIHRMQDQDGNDLVWFASGSATWLKEGRRYVVKATPKEHGEYKGRKQTVLTRVAVTRDFSEEAECDAACGETCAC
jgi:hypothetical protein